MRVRSVEYLEFSRTGPVEGGCVDIDNQDTEHADQKPRKDNGYQDDGSKYVGHRGHKHS